MGTHNTNETHPFSTDSGIVNSWEDFWAMTSPEVVLPSQMSGELQLTAEARLQVAVLQLAIFDLHWTYTPRPAYNIHAWGWMSRNSSTVQRRKELIDWIFRDKGEGAFSFGAVCSALGRDEQWMREKIRIAIVSWKKTSGEAPHLKIRGRSGMVKHKKTLAVHKDTHVKKIRLKQTGYDGRPTRNRIKLVAN